MKLLKLDKKYASELFSGKDFQSIGRFKIFSCDFGYVIQTERNEFLLTNARGVHTYTTARK